MALSRLLLKPMDTLDFNSVRKTQNLQQKSKVEFKNEQDLGRKPKEW